MPAPITLEFTYKRIFKVAYLLFIIVIIFHSSLVERTNFTGKTAQQFFVAGLIQTDPPQSSDFTLFRLEDLQSEKKQHKKINFLIPDNTKMIQFHDYGRATVLADHGDWQLIEFSYSDTYMSTSVYKAYKNRVEPVSYLLPFHMLYFIWFIIALIPALIVFLIVIKIINRFAMTIVYPLLMLLPVCTYAGHKLYLSLGATSLIDMIQNSAFGIFLICHFCLLFLVLYNNAQVDFFANKIPVIDNEDHLKTFKLMIRSTMYSQLILVTLLLLSIMMILISLFDFSLPQFLMMLVLLFFSFIIFSWLDFSHKSIKNIKCQTRELESKYCNIVSCWDRNLLPDC